MRWFVLIIVLGCFCAWLLAGCRDSNAAIEGKVNITSTKAFSNNKAMKSPPPQKPSQ